MGDDLVYSIDKSSSNSTLPNRSANIQERPSLTSYIQSV